MKYKEELVSCILPTFNRASWVKDRVGELLSQSHEDWELIIVDDHSTDDTLEVCEEYVKNYDNISYIKLDHNSGCVTIPRNIGICQAQGEYIAHIDDDVVSFPRKLEALVEALEDTSMVLAYGDRIDYYTDDTPNNPVGTAASGVVRVPNWNPLNQWGVDGGQFLYKSNVYEHIDLVFVRRGCDWELAKKIWGINDGGFVYVGGEVVSMYIWHTSNRSLDDSTKVKPINPASFASYLVPSTHLTFSLEEV